MKRRLEGMGIATSISFVLLLGVRGIGLLPGSASSRGASTVSFLPPFPSPLFPSPSLFPSDATVHFPRTKKTNTSQTKAQPAHPNPAPAKPRPPTSSAPSTSAHPPPAPTPPPRP